MGSLAVPAIVNAFNFMDGINGISGGTAAVWGLCVGTDGNLNYPQRVQGLVAAGMGVGFLPHNVPAASMFLGDVGSYIFGAGIAVTVVEGSLPGGKFNPVSGIATLGPLFPYLADTGATIARRVARRESVTVAHREHVYQQLVHELGLEHWVVSSIVAGVSLGCGVASRSRAGIAAALPIALAYLFAPKILRRCMVLN